MGAAGMDEKPHPMADGAGIPGDHLGGTGVSHDNTSCGNGIFTAEFDWAGHSLLRPVPAGGVVPIRMSAGQFRSELFGGFTGIGACQSRCLCQSVFDA